MIVVRVTGVSTAGTTPGTCIPTTHPFLGRPLTCAVFSVRLLEHISVEQDALLAQLLAMGFDVEEIERCQVAMATSSHSYSLLVSRD